VSRRGFEGWYQRNCGRQCSSGSRFRRDSLLDIALSSCDMLSTLLFAVSARCSARGEIWQRGKLTMKRTLQGFGHDIGNEPQMKLDVLALFGFHLPIAKPLGSLQLYFLGCLYNGYYTRPIPCSYRGAWNRFTSALPSDGSVRDDRGRCD
jgi:hypothetical protein